MSRPKPIVLVEHVNKANYKSEQILSSEGIWSVFYDSKPINLKSGNTLIAYPGPKYKKTSFSNPGHAINLAKKMNILFKTDLFTVVLLKNGEELNVLETTVTSTDTIQIKLRSNSNYNKSSKFFWVEI